MAQQEQNLVWIDLEMTGLNPEENVILEIATIITDSDLNILAYGPSLVIHHSDEILDIMDMWSREQHTKSGLLDKVRASRISIQEAAQQTLEFIQQYCIKDTALLAGNSVWQDRAFLRRYMPTIVAYLHYRLIDVTTIKELVSRWYPDSTLFEKADTHRALEDIKESIDELKYYRKTFFK